MHDERIERLESQLRSLYLRNHAGSGARKRANRLRRARSHGGRAWLCTFCGHEFENLSDVTLDHVLPLTVKEPGTHHRCQLACKACNNERMHVPDAFFRMYVLFRKQHNDFIIDAFPKRRRRRERKQARMIDRIR